MNIGRHEQTVLAFCHQGGGRLRLAGEHGLTPGTMMLVPSWSPHLVRRQLDTHVSIVSFNEGDLPVPLRKAVTAVRLGASPVRAIPEKAWTGGVEALLSDFSAEPDPPVWIHDVLGLVFRHSLQPLSLAELAARVAVSPAHLTTLVRRWTGQSLMQWSLQARLQEAALQLTDPANSVADVAQASGFADLSHFRRLFRRRYHQSPQEYRSNECF